MNNFNDELPEFKVNLSLEEKIACLKEILTRLKKILYVYDRSKEEGSNYNYKVFLGGIMIYISSSNALFNGELVNILVNLKAILDNDFEKPQIKRIVFESRNQIECMLAKYKKIKDDSENLKIINEDFKN